MANERIGDQLIKNALITPEQLLEAQKAQKVSGTRLGSQLVKLGHITEEQLVDFLGKQYGLPSIILKDTRPDIDIIKLIPLNIVQKYNAIAFDRTGSTLKVAMTDPTNIFAVDDLKFLTGYSIDVHVTSEESLKWAMDHFYDQAASMDDALSSFEEDAGNIEVATEGGDLAVGDLEKEADQAPVIKLVNLTLVDAIKKGASDIHIEPYEKYMRIRFRLDGMLYEVMKPPIRLKNALVFPASRSWPGWTSPSAGCLRTDASSSASRGARRWRSASPCCPPCSARRWFSESWTNPTSSST
jgi:type IV pilus assembly protein PilB